MIIERKYCTKCKTKEQPLIKYSKYKKQDGDTLQYYVCRNCNNKRHGDWYEKNKTKQLIYNRRYRIRKEMNE